MDCSKNGSVVDLHVHSTASDGSLSPRQLIDLSVQAGLAAISITDHDSIDGCREIIETGTPLPIEFMTGVEVSAAYPVEFPRSGSLHILGYGIDINHPALNEHLKNQQQSRNQRCPQIVQRLNDLGIPLRLDEVVVLSGGDQVGRPHIARALKKNGWVTSVNEAFDKYIGKQGPAYVEKERLACELTLDLIDQAGGIPVLAHPGLIDTADHKEVEELVNILTAKGLKGLEVFYPGHSDEQTRFYTDLTARYNLLPTGGTDFHGAINPEIKLGVGTGDLAVSYSLYESLAEHVRQKQRSTE